MGKTRIRWRNVARLAAGAAVAALLLALTGAMLKPKPPEPLPADVGLDGIRGQAVAYTPPERTHEPDRRPRRDEPSAEHVSPAPKHHPSHRSSSVAPQAPPSDATGEAPAIPTPAVPSPAPPPVAA